MPARPLGRELNTASAGESDGRTPSDTIPVLGKFPIRIRNQNQEDERVAETQYANRKPYYLTRMRSSLL
jgi:hypothetical protein